MDVIVNGATRTVDVAGDRPAVELVRDALGLTGTKLACGAGVCGACTVQVDGTPMVSCLLPCAALRGRSVTTVEGLGGAHPVQRAFAAHDALQCGYCTPGFVVEATAFVDRWRAEHGDVAPERETIAAAMSGHLCRCGAYPGIYAAVAAACTGAHDADAVLPPNGAVPGERLDPAPARAASSGSARVEAVDKVTGRARYTTDVRLDGQLEGALVRSPVAHGVVRAVTPPPGVTMVDLLAADRTVRYAGQPIAAVAATTAAQARAAADRTAVNIDQLPAALHIDHTPTPRHVGVPVLTPREVGVPASAAAHTAPQPPRDAGVPALTPREVGVPQLAGAAARADGQAEPPVYGSRAARRGAPVSAEGLVLPARWRGNVRGPTSMSWRGGAATRRVERARHRGDQRLVSATFSTAVQVHTPLEPHACVAHWPAPDELHLYASSQAVAELAEAAAKRWKLPPQRVRVVAEHVGGGFGAKVAMTVEVVAAVELARATGRPVRVVLDRAEELTDAGNRPGTVTELNLLADGRGRLAALTLDVHGTGGVSIGSSVAALGRFMYGNAPRRLRDYDVVTNHAPGTPFRGPGGPPLAWALEQAVDELALRLGEDPIALRRRWDGNRRRRALYDRAAALPLWAQRPAPGSQHGRFRRGVGVAAANWLYLLDPSTSVELVVDGGVVVARTATQDMGTGSRTVIAGVVCAELGLPADRVRVEIGRSATVHGPTSGGSRTTASVAPAAADAARRLRTALLSRGSNSGGSVLGLLDGADGVRVVGRRPRDRRGYVTPFNIAGLRVGRGFSGAVHVTEVEVDTRLGRVRPLRVWGGVAAGHIYHERLARSQCEGSVVQGIGFALYEQRHTDPVTGAVLTDNLEDYRIPGIGDTPEIEIHFHQDGWDHVSGGGVGLGEVATIGVAASIGNAVRAATGWRPRQLPIRPDRLLDGIRSLEGRGPQPNNPELDGAQLENAGLEGNHG